MKRRQNEVKTVKADVLESKRTDACKYQKDFDRAVDSVTSVISDLTDMNIDIEQSICTIIEYQGELEKVKEEMVFTMERNKQVIKNYMSLIGFDGKEKDNG